MKKVLITGAAGAVGLCLIKYLLAEGKYEITAIDLKNHNVYKRLHRYRKRINIIYGDILDRTLIEDLVKDNDIIIHLVTCLPPFSEYKRNLVDIIDYNSSENIIRAINYYNPKCHFIYASTTSLYKENIGNATNKISLEDYDYYSNAKLKVENLLSKKIKHYTIVRIPLVLGDLRKDHFIYSINLKEEIELITKEDAAYALCQCVVKLDKLERKTIDIGGGKQMITTPRKLLINILKYHGLSWNFVLTKLFCIKNYYSPVLNDSDESNKLLKYRNDSLDSYFMKQKRRSITRKLHILFAKPFIYFLKRKEK